MMEAMVCGSHVQQAYGKQVVAREGLVVVRDRDPSASQFSCNHNCKISCNSLPSSLKDLVDLLYLWAFGERIE